MPKDTFNTTYYFTTHGFGLSVSFVNGSLKVFPINLLLSDFRLPTLIILLGYGIYMNGMYIQQISITALSHQVKVFTLTISYGKYMNGMYVYQISI